MNLNLTWSSRCKLVPKQPDQIWTLEKGKEANTSSRRRKQSYVSRSTWSWPAHLRQHDQNNEGNRGETFLELSCGPFLVPSPWWSIEYATKSWIEIYWTRRNEENNLGDLSLFQVKGSPVWQTGSGLGYESMMAMIIFAYERKETKRSDLWILLFPLFVP